MCCCSLKVSVGQLTINKIIHGWLKGANKVNFGFLHAAGTAGQNAVNSLIGVFFVVLDRFENGGTVRFKKSAPVGAVPRRKL
jgi:hypothetical protein